MPKFNWLHLTDFHQGMKGQKHRWPNVRAALFDDLERQYGRTGRWDAVLFTGDLVQSGTPDEFNALDEVLGELWEFFAKLDSPPVLLAVPGNHDLVRPKPKANVRMLTKWAQNPEIHNEFWEDDNSEYRQVVNEAFANYLTWFNRCRFVRPLSPQNGLLPGDFSVTVEKDDLRIGVVGLNIAFLQLEGGDFKTRLAWDSRQFHTACGGDGAAWVGQHHACILMTHQPPTWLDEHSREKEYGEIAPAGRFAVHLFGHMHEHLIHSESVGGGPARRSWQGCSLFGLEYFGEEGEAESRSHGYALDQIEVENNVGRIRTWPRVALYDKANGWRIVADHKNFKLENDEGIEPQQVDIQRPKSHSKAPPPRVNKQASQRTVSRVREAADPGAFQRAESGRWPWPHDEPVLRSYCEALAQNHGHIQFVEVPFLKDTSDVEIDSLYVIPQLSEQEVHADAPPDTWPKRDDAISALQKHRRLVVLGDPGSGKSTLINSLTWQLSRPAPAVENPWSRTFGGLVPLPIVLRELTLKADLTWAGLLESFLEHRVGKFLRTLENVEALLKSGRAYVLLDGLDEIGNLAVRRRLRAAVHAGMAEYQAARWVLTSRIVGYEQVPFHLTGEAGGERRAAKGRSHRGGRPATMKLADLLYLSPFSDTQIKDFSHNWYAQHEKDPSLVKENAEGLVSAIRDNEGTQRLARIPYLLTLMALIHRKDAKLPHGRTELYERIAAAYLESIDARRKLDQLPYSLAQKKRWLSEIAYRMQRQRAASGADASERREILVAESVVCGWLSKAIREEGADDPEQEATALLDYFARRSGLLLPRGEGQFAFMHLSLQEYFTAYYLEPRLTASRFAPVQKKADPTDAELRKWANEAAWRETFVLLFELLAAKAPHESEGFLSHLFARRFEKNGGQGQHNAGQLLAELVVDPYVKLSAETRKQMRQRCWLFLFNSDDYASARIARTLIVEQGGDLFNAWQAAGLSSARLKSAVKTLTLSDCTILTDLGPLAALENIQSLILDGCISIDNLTPLKGLKRLERLRLSGCTGVKNLAPLRDLKKLTSLNINGCTRLSDITPLSTLTGLRELFMSNCPRVTDISPLGKLTRLQTLGLGSLPNSAYLKVLASLPDLRELGIEDLKGRVGLGALAGLKNLRSLHLHKADGNVNLKPLVRLTNLQALCLMNAKVETIPPQLRPLLLYGYDPSKKVARKAKSRKKTARKGAARKSRKSSA